MSGTEPLLLVVQEQEDDSAILLGVVRDIAHAEEVIQRHDPGAWRLQTTEMVYLHGGIEYRVRRAPDLR